MSKPRTSITTLPELKAEGLIKPADQQKLEPVVARYAVGVTPAMAELIDKADPNDPIALQFLPRAEELITTPDEISDPIGDNAHSPVPGIVHRHADRVLLKIVDVCAVYCRFCFRREMIGPGGAGVMSSQDVDDALAYIGSRPEIWEVILTGGDPFVLSHRRIAELTQRLAAIDHVKVVRWHTRVPVVAPERVTGELVRALSSEDAASYVVVHTNHAREMTTAARHACARLADAGIPLLSQTVLLKGVNDNVETLSELMRTLVSARIKPYYLHHGDLAPGTSHFRTTLDEGCDLMDALREHLSGLCLPTYVIDLPGGHGKVPLGRDDLTAGKNGPGGSKHYTICDAAGQRHIYMDRDAEKE